VLGIAHAGYSLSTLEGGFDAAGGVRSGMALNLGLDIADDATGSSESLYAASYRVRGYVPMPWAGEHVLAIASAGAIAAGTYPRRSLYYVGGYDLENTSFLDTITSGAFNGAFPLRGYPANSYSGSVYLLQNLEYRFPIADVDRGISTVPVYLRRIDGNLFLDFGGAFDKLDYQALELFSKGSLLYSPQMHTAVGAELWFGATIAYALDLQFRFGYAYGFSAEALPGGQGYFVASSAF
jgi:outer membrane protein assembly factor BamA